MNLSHYVPGYVEVPANEMLPEGMKTEKAISLKILLQNQLPLEWA